jgi:DNA polymerase elongation subunit (family B)
MQMKREAISEAAIWTGAKRYIMSVWNNEGVAYDPPYFKMTGIEAVRSSTPTICRDAIKQAARIILNSDQSELYGYIDCFREEFFEANPSMIARNSSVKGLEKYIRATKGAPMHVKAALTYNRMISDKGLANTYPKITDGDRIKYVSLKMPNPSRSEVVAFPNSYLPPELDIERYIDREDHFEVGFMRPIRSIANAAGVKVDRISTLEDFFS